MNRGIWAALALLCATPSARAQQTPAQQAPAATGTSAKAGASTSSSKSGDKGSAKKPKKGKEPEPSGPSREARAYARRMKSLFMFAAESCTGGRSTCDSSLVDDAERRFLDACGACTSSQRCEAERDEIRAGTAAGHSDPCAP